MCGLEQGITQLVSTDDLISICKGLFLDQAVLPFALFQCLSKLPLHIGSFLMLVVQRWPRFVDSLENIQHLSREVNLNC